MFQTYRDVSKKVGALATTVIGASFVVRILANVVKAIGGGRGDGFLPFFSLFVLVVGAVLINLYNKVLDDGTSANMFLYGAIGALIFSFLLDLIGAITGFNKNSIVTIILCVLVIGSLGATLFFHKQGNKLRRTTSIAALVCTAILEIVAFTNVLHAPFLFIAAGVLEILGNILVFGAVVCITLDESNY